MDGGFLSGLPGLRRIGIWANASAVRISEPGLDSGFAVGGGKVVSCKRGLVASKASCISPVAADGVCRCDAPASMAIDVADRWLWARREMLRVLNVAGATILFGRVLGFR